MLFDLIAPVYDLFYGYQQKNFRAILRRDWEKLGLSGTETLIDLGAGTGSLSSVFAERGIAVTGVDRSPGMIRRAKMHPENRSIRFYNVDARSLPFPDKSFDIAFASFVAHGLEEDQRRRLYQEMKRLSRKIVLIHDYNATRNFLVNVAEWAEGGDYFNFIRTAAPEMKTIFRSVRTIPAGSRSSWYICDPSSSRKND